MVPHNPLRQAVKNRFVIAASLILCLHYNEGKSRISGNQKGYLKNGKQWLYRK
jgi:hypothetical protein